jgi:hypothetical protein
MLERAVVLTWLDVAQPVSNVRRHEMGMNLRIAKTLRLIGYRRRAVFSGSDLQNLRSRRRIVARMTMDQMA